MKTKVLNTPEQVKELARETVEKAEQEQIKKRNVIKESLEALNNLSANFEGFEGVALLLALPEDQFAFMAPVFLSEYQKSLNRVNDQMSLVQALNVAGLKSEDVLVEYKKLCDEIDNQLQGDVSRQKRDFLKQMMGSIYNALAEAEGVAKKNILIPLEFCHTNAKMPAYAHLTDSGMDVYALEDITIAPGETKLIPIGIKVAIPAGYELQVRPKSGRCLKTKLRVANTPGTIDAGYRDEIAVIIDNIEPFIKSAEMDENGRLYNVLFGSSYTIGKGEKFAQLVLAEVPKAIFYEVEKVADIANDGRNGGFGSSGLK